MKLLIVLVATLAFVNADVSELVNKNNFVRIVSQTADAAPDGSSFANSFEAENGIRQEANGAVVDINSDAPKLQVQGRYYFVAPEGIPIDVQYTAGVEGYQPKGESLPTSPPIPELILKALQWTAARTAASRE